MKRRRLHSPSLFALINEDASIASNIYDAVHCLLAGPARTLRVLNSADGVGSSKRLTAIISLVWKEISINLQTRFVGGRSYRWTMERVARHELQNEVQIFSYRAPSIIARRDNIVKSFSLIFASLGGPIRILGGLWLNFEDESDFEVKVTIFESKERPGSNCPEEGKEENEEEEAH
ncbi:hypothetical protein PRIPAC_94906 [Pristionchus pacificus]|uniref:Uncharacterized protein n=1 Tax=Pristionchus pacificus TaxID=54126 RepID=A0A2A6BQ25_PRIPA|nr:hypothetical protein PRIPAC_94906 [Pristionchus pacificus]|eukprot:PDM68052.1 hypothetical protein PRIPAC_46096 [Pristionchus pacificus]